MLKLAYKSRRYRQYVEWIAYNDSDADGPNVERIADYLTTTMLAHVNNLTTLQVAKDVAAMRRERDELDPVEPLPNKAYFLTDAGIKDA